MAERIIMNSEFLQKKFPEIYQEMFSKCSLVCSAPRSFPWFGEQSVRYEGLVMRQNLPLKTYVGLIPLTKEKGIKILQCQTFNPANQSFRKENFDYYQKEKIETYLPLFLKKEIGIEIPDGLGIYILNEIPYERGLGSGVFFSILITSLLIFFQQLEKSDIANWKKASSLELKNNKDLKFDKTFRLIWKWENFLYPGTSGGNLVGIIPSNSPILYFSKTSIPSQVRLKKQLKLDELNFVDKSNYWPIRFNEIYDQPTEVIWPFDFGLIYTGENRDIRDAINLVKKINAGISDNAAQCELDLKSYMKDCPADSIPALYKICQNKETVWEKYISTLVVHSLQSTQAFKKIASDHFSDETFKELVELINKEQYLFYLLNFSSPKLNNFISSLREILKKHSQEDTHIGIKMAGSSRRGDVVFMAESHHLRKNAEDAVNKLKEDFGSEISLDYASWLDGYENEGGIKIEQFWQEKIYSPFVPEDSLILKEIKGEGVVTHLSSYDKLKRENYTILLDTLENKIYIKGRPLTSKNLPSQAATIQILTALLESDTRSLSNSNLPSFSYTKYRNEMQGKIVGPLTKLTDGKIKISLEGGLMNFVVRLEVAKSSKIGILEKIG